MNGFGDAGDVEDQLIRLAGHRLQEVWLRHTMQVEHNVLQSRDRSREGNEAKTVLFRGLSLRGQVKREGMVAPATGEVGGPNLRSVIPVAGRRLEGIEDGQGAENWSANTLRGHDAQRVHGDRPDGLNALVADRGALAKRAPRSTGTPLDAVVP